MVNILKEFQTAQEPFTLSFDFGDYVQDVGYLRLYAGTAEDASGAVRFLNSDSDLASQETVTTALQATDNDYTFTITFNKSTTLNGTATLNISFYALSVYSSSESFTNTITAGVYHYDTAGASETQIDTDRVEVATSPGSSTTKYEVLTGLYDFDNLRVVSGDEIRLKVNMTLGGSSNSNSSGGYYHSPKNFGADSNNRFTQLKLNLPVKLT